MKVRNAVVGMEVQVKRDCHGLQNEPIKKSLVCTIKRINKEDDEYELKLVHPVIDGGYAWVNASDVRRYIKPTASPEPIVKLTKGTRVRVKSTVVGAWGESLQEGDIYILRGDEDVTPDGKSRRIKVYLVDGGSSWATQPKYFDILPSVLPDEVPVEPQYDIQVGDSVLVGSEGAGFLHVDTKYAGLVCTVVDDHYNPECVQISHPDVRLGAAYSTLKKYLSIPVSTCTELTIEDTTVGDYVVCSTSASHLTAGVAYRVVGYTDWGTLLISNPHPVEKQWAEGYAVEPKYFNKVLREVNNAEARVA